MMPLTEPSGAQPLLNAARWVENTLLGSTAMVVATLAVATLGFLMLNGRVPFRRGAVIIVGCFVLFGAVTLARGIMTIAWAGDRDIVRAPIAGSVTTPPVIAPPPAQPRVYDPYAGAAVPVR